MQLHMIWSPGKGGSHLAMGVPRGYSIRTFRDSDRDGWISLMRASGFDSWGQESVKRAVSAALPEGIYFAVHDASGELVGTAMAGHAPTELHPFGGELGWVGVSPAHRGKRLSTLLCFEVVQRFLRAGYREIYLQTDDWRLPAIKTYVNLGFVPLLCSSEMEERWRLAARNLGLSYEALGAIER